VSYDKLRFGLVFESLQPRHKVALADISCLAQRL